jgi:hypothetical protein
MWHRFSMLMAGVSLVLCAATVALWVRSYRQGDGLRWVGTNVPPHAIPEGSVCSREVEIQTNQGAAYVRWSYYSVAEFRGGGWPADVGLLRLYELADPGHFVTKN